MLTLKQVDKQAFESLLSRLKLSFQDLSRNDNRSQFPSPERNLDYRVRLPRDREALVELEGRDMPKGRLQPSKAWLKEDELESLLAWENADPRKRIALVV